LHLGSLIEQDLLQWCSADDPTAGSAAMVKFRITFRIFARSTVNASDSNFFDAVFVVSTIRAIVFSPSATELFFYPAIFAEAIILLHAPETVLFALRIKTPWAPGVVLECVIDMPFNQASITGNRIQLTAWNRRIVSPVATQFAFFISVQVFPEPGTSGMRKFM
jgi:hypothetical protein